jgi:single-stranded-DNA-specific exonuclease
MQIPARLSRMLDSRGITGVARETFLSPASWSRMEAPESLPSMVAVRDRILRAIRGKQPTAIYGDYDADGVLSSSILARKQAFTPKVADRGVEAGPSRSGCFRA